jgi:hypothetical protein
MLCYVITRKRSPPYGYKVLSKFIDYAYFYSIYLDILICIIRFSKLAVIVAIESCQHFGLAASSPDPAVRNTPKSWQLRAELGGSWNPQKRPRKGSQKGRQPSMVPKHPSQCRTLDNRGYLPRKKLARIRIHQRTPKQGKRPCQGTPGLADFQAWKKDHERPGQTPLGPLSQA